MAIPAAFTRTTVTDELFELDGTLATGTVTFWPSAGVLALSVPPDDFSVLAGELSLTATIVAGTFELNVPATDVDGVTPAGWFWLVELTTEKSGRRRWSKLVPTSNDPLRLTQLADYVPPRDRPCPSSPTPWHAGYRCVCPMPSLYCVLLAGGW